jgi:hypothetical protein
VPKPLTQTELKGLSELEQTRPKRELPTFSGNNRQLKALPFACTKLLLTNGLGAVDKEQWTILACAGA